MHISTTNGHKTLGRERVWEGGRGAKKSIKYVNLKKKNTLSEIKNIIQSSKNRMEDRKNQVKDLEHKEPEHIQFFKGSGKPARQSLADSIPRRIHWN